MIRRLNAESVEVHGLIVWVKDGQFAYDSLHPSLIAALRRFLDLEATVLNPGEARRLQEALDAEPKENPELAKLLGEAVD